MLEEGDMLKKPSNLFSIQTYHEAFMIIWRVFHRNFWWYLVIFTTIQRIDGGGIKVCYKDTFKKIMVWSISKKLSSGYLANDEKIKKQILKNWLRK